MKSLIIYLLCLQSLTGIAQTFNTDKIKVKWNLKENNYGGSSSFMADFVIINEGKNSFPIQASELYFSYPRKVTEVLSKNATFNNLGGEFCSIQFAENLGLLAPKDSIKVTYLALGKSMNLTDAPSGLYWVNKKSNQSFPVANFIKNYLPNKEKSVLKLSPAKVYAKNKDISLIPAQQLQPILPTPVFYKPASGQFQLTTATVLKFDSSFTNEANEFNAELLQLLGKKLSVNNKVVQSVIHLKKVTGLATEAYQIIVNKDEIVISASFPAGIFYGLQSLKMMMPANSWAKKQKSIAIPCANVNDEPRFGYRSFMLDVARNFQTKQQIFKILDLLALYKINTFHFHFSDDEGWRLEIPGLPELTEIGAKRGHTLDDSDQIHPSYGSGAENNFPGTGFYSKADFIEILKYAKTRHIKVIPEVETPGHARAAIKAMDARYRRFMKLNKPEEAKRYLLTDTLDQSIYTSVQDFNDNVMNIALPSTYTFIEKVVDEIKQMYVDADAPLETIHLGGDEVPQGVWQKSPAIKQFMLNENIKHYDDLWYKYLAKANEILKAKNLYLSGWEEVAMRKTKLDGKPLYIANPDFSIQNFHAYVWNNVWGWGQEDLAYRLANAGYKVILAPVTNFYFDLAYEKDADEPGLYWGSYLDVDKPFYYNPFDHYKTAKEDPLGNPIDTLIFKNKERLTDYGISNIVGLQAQIWSEKIRGPQQLEYMLLPKLLGFAERTWAQTPNWITENNPEKADESYHKDWNAFVNILGQRELKRLDHYAGGFNYRIPTAGATIENGKVLANLQLPGFSIKYTINGTEPNMNSKTYTSPIPSKGIIKLKVFNTNGRSGRTVEVENP
ncbi:family 20 glycosylhydrolase [Pedobacter alpinus]|uniref:beta-N-acetylhexosaminidase n=1 Tax=Pedobacter alpinus TaxID=1590643 RepID=A0ABW5TTM0_9SPHI